VASARERLTAAGAGAEAGAKAKTARAGAEAIAGTTHASHGAGNASTALTLASMQAQGAPRFLTLRLR